MKHLLRPALGAVLVLVVAACADPSGQPWTPPPAGTPAAETTAPASQAPASAAPESAAPASAAPESAAPATAAPASEAPASAAPSAVASAPAESVAPGESTTPGEARVIELELTGALEIKENGAKVTEIPVTPGETITFKVTNTAGYAHNFWIGTDQELMLNQTQGLAGIPDFTTGTEELTWTVPADVTGLKFGCTVPGHYTLMQGTFVAAEGGATASVAPASAAPASAAPASAAPASPAASVPATSAEPAGRVIELELTAALQIMENGVQVKDIPVTPGETIICKLHNTAGYVHNFWIGPDQSLATNQTTGLVGEPDWTDGEIKELTWVVPDDITGLHYGCTVPGHYSMMNGVFSVAA